MNKQRGVTLLELMIVIVVLGILVAVAYPSYTKQVQRTRRAECAGGLVQLANAMERYFSQNNTYAGATTMNTLGTDQCPIDGGTRTYDLDVASTATTYTLSAVPQGGQANDKCKTLEIDQTGNKDSLTGLAGVPTGLGVDQCWR